MQIQSVKFIRTQSHTHDCLGHRYIEVQATVGMFKKPETFVVFWPKGQRMRYESTGVELPASREIRVFNALKDAGLISKTQYKVQS